MFSGQVCWVSCFGVKVFGKLVFGLGFFVLGVLGLGVLGLCVRVRVRVRRALPIFFWSPTPGTEPTYALLY